METEKVPFGLRRLTEEEKKKELEPKYKMTKHRWPIPDDNPSLTMGDMVRRLDDGRIVPLSFDPNNPDAGDPLSKITMVNVFLVYDPTDGCAIVHSYELADAGRKHPRW